MGGADREGLKMMTSDSSKKVIVLCRQSTIVPVEGGFSCLFHQPCSRQYLDVGQTGRYLLCSSKTPTQ